ncbi:MAG TPA: NAD(P)H-binding protein, partial [Flavitalea sp.]|nr:NAD(P)H-binding protein [Flavitalea sp.]
MEGIVLGGSGLIGKELIRQLLKDPAFLIVRALVRAPLDIEHPKFLSQTTNFSDEEDFREKIGTGSVVFCCIGTTMKNVNGDKVAYKMIDYDIAINAARFASEKQIKHFAIVSAIGANANSRNFYLRLKGKIEEDLKAIPFNSIHIFRPSLLLGDRKNESRPAEAWMQKIFKGIAILLPDKYKPVYATDVAAAMIAAAKKNKTGVR